MTMIITRPGALARRRRAFVAVAVSVLLGLLAVFAPSTARAATTPTPSPTPTLSGVVSLTLAPTGDGVLRAGEALTAWLTVANGTEEMHPGGTGTLALGAAALADRGALTAWIEGDGELADGVDVGTVAVGATDPGEDVTGVVSVDGQDPNLANRAPGVYPLAARLDSAGGTLTSRSVLVVPRTDGATPVGLVVPVTAQPVGTALLSSDELAELTAPDGALTGVLDAVAGTSAILAVDPAIPAAIRVLGRSAPANATTWLDRLLALPNERFALQLGDADIAVQLQSGASAPLQPTSLQSLMSPADFTAVPGADDVTPSPTPTPSPTTTPGGIVYPTLDELLDIGATRDGVFWPASGTAGADVVAVLGAQPVDGGASVTFLDSASTAVDVETAPARGQAGDAAVLVYDSAVSDALREIAEQPDATLRGATVADASAFLSFATASGTPVLAVLDRPQDVTRQGLRAAVLAVAQAPGTTAASLTSLIATTPAPVTVDEIAPDEPRVTAATELIADEERLKVFSSVLTDPSLLLGPERAQILQLLGAGWFAESDRWTTAVAAHRTASQATLDAVGILPPSNVNLIASGAPLGFWVRNDLPWPVQVTLFATPDDLRLDVETDIDVTVDAASNKRVEVPVQSRIGTGEVTVELQLRSATGVTIGAPQVFDVNVRADWEVGGGIILGVLVVGFLVVGVIRTVRRRRATATADGDADAEETS